MTPKSPVDESSGWLDALEERVRQAAERLRELGAENDRLRAEVARLERELAAAAPGAPGAPGASAGGSGAADDAEAEAWREERAELRRRVEGLVERLGELLSI